MDGLRSIMEEPRLMKASKLHLTKKKTFLGIIKKLNFTVICVIFNRYSKISGHKSVNEL